jgi:hypothetical protein
MTITRYEREAHPTNGYAPRTPQQAQEAALAAFAAKWLSVTTLLKEQMLPLLDTLKDDAGKADVLAAIDHLNAAHKRLKPQIRKAFSTNTRKPGHEGYSEDGDE